MTDYDLEIERLSKVSPASPRSTDVYVPAEVFEEHCTEDVRDISDGFGRHDY